MTTTLNVPATVTAFDLTTGLAASREPLRRTLSAMADMYADADAVVLDTAEIYFCLAGRGYMLMENPEGDVQWAEFVPGQGVYVPRRYAHRSINTGAEPLITFFAFPGHAATTTGRSSRMASASSAWSARASPPPSTTRAGKREP
jgi:glucose-6-phosphate isomerase